MYSTDHNINNPLSINGIDLSKKVESWRSPTIQIVSQEMYDLLQIKDPLTIYVIHGDKEGRMYFGEHLIQKDTVSSKYFIGIDNERHEYVLYMNIRDSGKDKLVPISRYDNPITAFDALTLCSNSGSHQNTALSLFSVIASFIDGLTNVNDLVLGSICLFGYKNDPRLQHLIEIALSYGAVHAKYEVSSELLGRLANEPAQGGNPLFRIYLDVYKTIEKYNFFRDDMYHQGVDKLDLSEPIADIIAAIGEYTSPFGEY